MTPWTEIESVIDGVTPDHKRLLRAAEQCLENWVEGQGSIPSNAKREGFRLLALHFQGAKEDPSFNACRETCREIVYHHNLLDIPEALMDRTKTSVMMALLVNHVYFFVRGKMEVAGLGEFCCSAKPVRSKDVVDLTPELGD